MSPENRPIRESGGAGNFRVGYAFQPAWTVGGEASVWTKKVDDVTWTFSVASGTVTWFPSAQGFFVRGGIGVGKVEAAVSGSGFSFAASESGLGLMGAFGHEWRLTRKFALGPQFEFSWMDVGDEVTANFVNLNSGGQLVLLGFLVS